MANFLQRIPPVTRNILFVNIIVFIATMIGTGFHPRQADEIDVVTRLFALYPPYVHGFHLWQPITHMFVHYDLWHILFNMYALVMFGGIVEQVLGTKRFIILYFVSGLGAAALQTLVEWLSVFVFGVGGLSLSMGASGAIYGILVAFAMLYPQARLTLIFPPITLDAKWMVLIFIGIELFLGFAEPQWIIAHSGASDPQSRVNVAHFAHLGGALFGFLLVWYWRKSGKLWRR